MLWLILTLNSVHIVEKSLNTLQILALIAGRICHRVSLTLTFIEINAKIVDTGYTVSAQLYQKDKATALPKFVQTLIAIHNIVGNYD